MTQFFTGLAVSVLIAYFALRSHSLSTSGAYAAAFVGTVIFGLGGWQWAIPLLTFFVTSSALSRAFKNRKRDVTAKYSKGYERDAGQVFGNGGIATLFAALHAFFPNEVWPWLGFTASLAAVNADTWATELGVLNLKPPRLITDLTKVVEKGTSGGISLIGTLASLAGAALIGILAESLYPEAATVSTFFVITLAGFTGSLFDSLLGATVQAIYFCPNDQKETEQHPLHACGTPTSQIRGWKWLDNDLVNIACGAFGVVITQLISGIF